MIDLMINLTNDSLFSAFFKPKFEVSVEKKSCSSLLVYLLYEVVFLYFAVDFSFIK